VNSGDVPNSTAMQIWATPGLSAGISFVKSEYRLLQVADAADDATTILTTAYTARFGVPAVGTKVFVKVVFVNKVTGQASTAQSVFDIVV